MTDIEKILLGAVLTLVVSALLFVARRLYVRFSDRVVVEARLSIGGDNAEIEKFGCPGLVLTLKCRSHRPAKVAGASLCFRGKGFMKAFQAGFDSDLGLPGGPASGSPETMKIGLQDMATRDRDEGYVLERDDVCNFYLPMIGVPQDLYLRLIAAPSEDITVRMGDFGGEEKTVLSGFYIQDSLRGLLDMYADNVYEYRSHTKMQIELQVDSKVPLSGVGGLAGTTNPHGVALGNNEAAQHSDGD